MPHCIQRINSICAVPFHVLYTYIRSVPTMNKKLQILYTLSIHQISMSTHYSYNFILHFLSKKNLIPHIRERHPNEYTHTE